MRKKIARATGGIVTTLFLAGASTTFAQTTPPKVLPAGLQRSYQGPMIDEIATEFGLNVNDIKEELRLGKSPRQILEEQGISSSQINKLFKSKALSIGKKGLRARMSSEMVQAEAGALGVSIDQLKQDLQSGKTTEQIAQDEGMTLMQYHQSLVSQIEQLIQNGTISGTKISYYNNVIDRLNSAQ